ncbi:MAG: hypothetical protein Q8R55_00890 [Candidatus Taylorbacteria bacterium]|nr:hypothetical protein [Candidatus Taylorbacteria bacterium]
MPDIQTQLKSQIDETIKDITSELTELGLNIIRVEPCKEPERIREGNELMPHFSGGHFNGWFQVSSQEGNFKIGFVAESIPVLDLLDTGVTIKDILGGIPKEEEEEYDDDYVSNLNNILPLMNPMVLEVFIRLLKNRQHQ